MDDEIDREKELNRIQQVIVEICKQRIGQGQHLLLSDLGKMLADDLLKLKLISKGSLTTFLRDRLPQEFTLAAIGPHRNIFSVVRSDSAGVAPSESASELRNEEPLTSETTPKKRRYHYRFWAAFAVPITTPDTKRYVDVHSFAFRETKEPPLDTEIEITQDLIAAPDIPNRDLTIESNITKWLTQNGLSQEQFLATSSRPLEIHAKQISLGPSVLELLVGTLDNRQLQSISLPLDVVAALLKKRV